MKATVSDIARNCGLGCGMKAIVSDIARNCGLWVAA